MPPDRYDPRGSGFRGKIPILFIGVLLLPLLLLPSGVISSRGSVGPVYGTAPRGWSRIFEILNSSSHSAFRLPSGKDDLRSVMARYRAGDRSRLLSVSDFGSTTVPTPLQGELEWSPLLAGFGTLIQSPTYEELLGLLRQTTAESGLWRTRVDPLLLARFQNDILLAARSIHAFASRDDYPMGYSQLATSERVENLVQAMTELLDRLLMTEAELSKLPDTSTLRTDKGAYEHWETHRLYWLGRDTEHETVTLKCYWNEILVLYPKENSHLYSKPKVDQYIRDGAWPKADIFFILLDHLVVLDERRQLRRTPVTVMARTSRYYAKPDLQPAESVLGDFGLFYLRRRAHSGNWSSCIDPAAGNETGAALLNLPNVPGFASPYYEVPLYLSCIQCHCGGPKSPHRLGETGLIEDPRDFYIGEEPRGLR